MQSRGGKGIKAMNLTDKTGRMCCQLPVHEEEDILLITDDGTIIRMPVNDISTLGRNTQGVRLMRVEAGCKVVGVARAEADEETDEENGEIRTADAIDGIDLDDAPTEKQSDAPDALDRLVDSLESDPEPENDDDI